MKKNITKRNVTLYEKQRTSLNKTERKTKYKKCQHRTQNGIIKNRFISQKQFFFFVHLGFVVIIFVNTISICLWVLYQSKHYLM